MAEEPARSADWCDGYMRGHKDGLAAGWNAARQVYEGRPPEGHDRLYPRHNEEPPALPRKRGEAG